MDYKLYEECLEASGEPMHEMRCEVKSVFDGANVTRSVLARFSEVGSTKNIHFAVASKVDGDEWTKLWKPPNRRQETVEELLHICEAAFNNILAIFGSRAEVRSMAYWLCFTIPWKPGECAGGDHGCKCPTGIG